MFLLRARIVASIIARALSLSVGIEQDNELAIQGLEEMCQGSREINHLRTRSHFPSIRR
jgi:hypothetical protein